jgi:ribosomal protein S18 acetylase RimI-like enzyme
MPSIRIRPARSGDWLQLEKLVAGIAEFHGESHKLTRARFDELACGANPFVLVLVAETEDGTLAGYVAGFPIFEFHNGRSGFQVDNLYVCDNFRRERVGESLMLFLIQAAREKYQSERFKLGAKEWNSVAICFYKQMGFEENPQSSESVILRREFAR